MSKARSAKRLIAVAALSSFIAIAPGSAGAANRPFPCTWVHGRMTWGNGNPAVRIWPSGTHRKLGVVSTLARTLKGEDDGDLPQNVMKMMTPENNFTVWGDFHACPVTPERTGWMRFVRIDKTRRLLATPD
jgi:hypothetical protein